MQKHWIAVILILIWLIWTWTNNPRTHDTYPPPNDPLSPLAPRCNFILWVKCHFFCLTLRCISKRYAASLWFQGSTIHLMATYSSFWWCHGMQANWKRSTSFLDAHSVWMEDIRCDTCGAGRIYKAAWEFSPINWQTDIYLKHLTCLQQQNWHPPKGLTSKEKATFALSESEPRRDQTEVVSSRVWSKIGSPTNTFLLKPIDTLSISSLGKSETLACRILPEEAQLDLQAWQQKSWAEVAASEGASVSEGHMWAEPTSCGGSHGRKSSRWGSAGADCSGSEPGHSSLRPWTLEGGEGKGSDIPR